MNADFKCAMCGERFTVAELAELKEMGECYYKEKRTFLCPDCYDNFQRLTLEEQAEIVIKNMKTEINVPEINVPEINVPEINLGGAAGLCPVGYRQLLNL